MASLLKRLGSLLPKRARQGFAGYDMEGNSYFELPSPAGGRPKRTVEYKVNRDLAEYTSGQHRLPVQWTTWLSHTRTDPPTLEELQSDSARQNRLRPMIKAIEAREEAERIRQGYLPAPGSSTTGGGASGGLVEGYAHASMPRSISGPGPSRINTKPSFTPNTDSRSQPQSQPQPQRTGPTPPPTSKGASASGSGSGSASGLGQEYTVPTPTSRNVPPPPPTVDPLQHDDPAELRRLAEEDTKRRIEERGGEADLREGSASGSGKIEGVDVGPGGGGLAPRRRGKK